MKDLKKQNEKPKEIITYLTLGLSTGVLILATYFFVRTVKNPENTKGLFTANEDDKVASNMLGLVGVFNNIPTIYWDAMYTKEEIYAIMEYNNLTVENVIFQLNQDGELNPIILKGLQTQFPELFTEEVISQIITDKGEDFETEFKNIVLSNKVLTKNN